MSKYRISVSIDGKNFFWIVVDNRRLIRNPTKEDRIGTKLKSYNKTNICSRCIEENNITDSSILYPGFASREKDKEGKETGRWICHNCHGKYERKNNINCLDNVKKSITNRRTHNINYNCSCGKGDLFQELTVIWRSTISIVPIEDLT